jgi:hypothetical protein
MKNVKKLVPNLNQVPSALVGTIVQGAEQQFRVKTSIGLLPALTASSCLLVPKVGDRVTLVADSDMTYITAILVGTDKSDSQINVDGKLRVKAESVTFETEDTFEISSKTVNFNAPLANFKFGVLNQLALKMSFIAEKLDMTAKKLHRSAKQEYIVVNQQFERVTETKNTQAGRWIQRVHKQWISRSERTTLTAKKEMKLDGERIDLG